MDFLGGCNCQLHFVYICMGFSEEVSVFRTLGMTPIGTLSVISHTKRKRERIKPKRVAHSTNLAYCPGQQARGSNCLTLFSQCSEND
jgi:hypothetical protein